MELDWFGEPGAYTETDWSPNANGIYAQTITCLLLTFGHYCAPPYSGDTSLVGCRNLRTYGGPLGRLDHGFAGRTAL